MPSSVWLQHRFCPIGFMEKGRCAVCGSTANVLRGEVMLDRLRRVLVESYVGAIAMGWVLADCISHFVGIFSAPIAGWVSQKNYHDLTQKMTGPQLTGSLAFPFQDALPELVRTVLFLLIWYAVVRWLYYKPFAPTSLQPDADTKPDRK